MPRKCAKYFNVIAILIKIKLENKCSQKIYAKLIKIDLENNKNLRV